MLRRESLQSLRKRAVFALPSTAASATFAPTRHPLLGKSPIAGFRYHDNEALWPSQRIGIPLRLRRELDNHHHPRAGAVLAGTGRLGYVPRIDNCAISHMIDRGESPRARIAAPEASADPRRRTRLEIPVLPDTRSGDWV